MEPVSDSYETSALVYIRLVRKISHEAAVAIEQIYAQYGSHAALRAALIITLLKMEVQQNHWLPNLKLYEHLLSDYPQAVPLMNHAMNCCIKVWELPDSEVMLKPKPEPSPPDSNPLPPRDLWQSLGPTD